MKHLSDYIFRFPHLGVFVPRTKELVAIAPPLFTLFMSFSRFHALLPCRCLSSPLVTCEDPVSPPSPFSSLPVPAPLSSHLSLSRRLLKHHTKNPLALRSSVYQILRPFATTRPVFPPDLSISHSSQLGWRTSELAGTRHRVRGLKEAYLTRWKPAS